MLGIWNHMNYISVTPKFQILIIMAILMKNKNIMFQ